MSKFSLVNGLKMTYAQLTHDSGEFLLAFILLAVIPAVLFLPVSIIHGVSWFLFIFFFFVGVRCWDDPLNLAGGRRENNGHWLDIV